MYCQNCRTTLKVNSSIENLNPAAFDLLVGSANKTQRRLGLSPSVSYPQERKDLYNRVAEQSHSPVYRRNVPAPRSLDSGKHGEDHNVQSNNPSMSFVEITESQIFPPEKLQNKDQKTHTKVGSKEVSTSQESHPLSWHMKKHERLFSILSAHSDIDHPICTECSSILLGTLNARLASVTRERDSYASFLKTLQQVPSVTDSEEEAAKKELAALLEEDKTMFEELLSLEQQKRKLELELADLEEESDRIQENEKAFWRDRNAFHEKQHDIETDLISLQQKSTHDQQQLERLQRTNVYNDTFCIGHDGYFGTINGLRLGRLPTQNVEWAEINAAWGQTLLLLQTVAERLAFSFVGYRLRPLGSTSRIDKLEYPQQSPETSTTSGRATPIATANSPAKITPLDLFSSGDIPLGRVFNHRRFDAGMVAFLDCLSQLGSYMEKVSTGRSGRPGLSRTPSSRNDPLVLPYVIQGDKIGEVSIRLGVGFQQDENFTKACKYALTCCKFILAHVSNLDSSKLG